MNWAYRVTKWTLDMATKAIRSDVRMHNTEAIQPDMAIIFVVNHFTRLETMLLPYFFHKYAGLEVWALAAAELFNGKMGSYLQKTGTISTKNPDRDKIIISGLLSGDKPWIIFPEGAMIKDKKVIDHQGMFRVYSNDGRRSPHTGAAALALRAEFYRNKISCILDNPKSTEEEKNSLKEKFGLETFDTVQKKRTVIIPVNITYYPMRAHDNAVLRFARALAKDLSQRAVEELSVEGTLVSQDTDIDIVLGEPIDVKSFLLDSEHSSLMVCGPDDLTLIESDSHSLFNEAARRLMYRYMTEIYRLTTINYDHIFATIIRFQRARRFTERAYRNRIFLAAHELKKLGLYRMHSLLERTYPDVLFEDFSPKFHSFVDLCIKEGILQRDGNAYYKNFEAKPGHSDFHTVRQEEPVYVIANEVEPLTRFCDVVRDVAQMPRVELSRRIRMLYLEEDQRIFEEDYERWRNEEHTKEKEIGRPFLLLPPHYRAGVVLTHGYMAAPAEVLALANYLYGCGYAVYGVRLRGHGTSPANLAVTQWEEWYTSLNRGYAVIKSLTDTIVLGGFSTGGTLSMLAAARKQEKVSAVFAVNAPLKLQRFGARLAPTIVTMTSLLKRVRGVPDEWEYVENHPENKHINYTSNPLKGVVELGKCMDAMETSLKDIACPTLLIQGSKDPIVDPTSAMDIFTQVGTPKKELIILERDRHGIVNGERSQEVFGRIGHFLDWTTAGVTAAIEESPQTPGEELTVYAENPF
jgi:esterase/lipase/1-acyl-sn-glycerol-3-phosphate acyltransferase